MEVPSRDDRHDDDSFEAIGAVLADARLAQGMQVSEVAQLLRISKQYLKDIEAGDFDQLPGPTYVSGYLRTYAQTVGVADAGLAERYRQLLDAESATVHYKFPTDSQRPQRSGAMVASIVVMFAIVGYGGWYVMGKPDLTMLTGSDDTGVASNVVREATDKGGTPAAIISADSNLDVAVDVEDVDVYIGTRATATGDAGGDAGGDANASVTEQPAIATAQTGVQSELRQDDMTASVVDGDTDLASASAVAADDTASSNPDTNSMATATATDDEDASLAGLAQPAGSTTDTAQTGAAQTGTLETDAVDTAAGETITVETQAAETAAGNAVADGGADTSSPSSMSGVAYAGQPDPAFEITIRAKGTSWVEIIRNDGDEVMTRLMRDGEFYTVDSRDKLYLSTGNAGGIEIVFGDGLIKSVGEKGEILRDLPLDVERLRNQL